VFLKTCVCIIELLNFDELKTLNIRMRRFDYIFDWSFFHVNCIIRLEIIELR